MKKILLFGAGKSATVLIDYLLENAEKENWQLTLVDADLQLAKSKIGQSSFGIALSFDINNETERKKNIKRSDIVISLLPPALHYVVAQDCVELKKDLLTASYVDDQIKNLKSRIEDSNLLFLCEMGLDPGIDHMSAMKMIDDIHSKNGHIISFQSHCGGLVAPESDDNPWRYKISWNPRSVVLAGKSGAHYKENGEEKRLQYEDLFSADRAIEIPELGYLSWYPNRDSLSYAALYNLEEAETFIRTTLRYPDFMYGWRNVVELKMTDETPKYETNGRALYEVFKEHMDKNGFGKWLEQKLADRFSQTKEMLNNLVKLMEVEKEAKEEDLEIPDEFMSVDEKGNITEIELDDVKNRAASFLAYKMHEANLTLKQLFFLGLDDKETIVNKGLCSAADLLQFALERKLALKPDEKDMIVMMHEIKFVIGSQQSAASSLLIVKGENNVRTAMAKTVGLPLGIATKLILNGTIKLKGLHIPTKKEIYDPVLKELEEHGIKFEETNE
ncbi:MAG TPA: saccharopine dehydrogenase C-terminal domain-containing protein [Chitinophagaceae bacterium]|nr:saccharopine dehydrogenase C-terminal domain-containing protein [Chitinophagaceae bacterium]